MGNRKRYAKFQENLFSSNEIKSIFCPPLFRKRPILAAKGKRSVAIGASVSIQDACICKLGESMFSNEIDNLLECNRFAFKF